MYSLIDAAFTRDHLILHELLNRNLNAAHAYVISVRRMNGILCDLQFS